MMGCSGSLRRDWRSFVGCLHCTQQLITEFYPPVVLEHFVRHLISMATNSKSLKARLISVVEKEEEPLYGLFMTSFSPTLAEIAGQSGYDFVVIDMQHGHGDIPNALPCLHALAATQTPTILRLPDNSAVWAKKALDLGPQGLLFPAVNHPDSAQNAVLYCGYPPKGVRGAGHPAVRASGYGLDQEYLAKCEKELLIMCHVESVEGVDRVRDIASVDGVDCIMLGSLDMDLSETRNQNKVRMAENAVLELTGAQGTGNGPCLAGFAMTQPLELKRRGYHMVCGSVDVTLFRDAALANVNSFNNSTSLN